MTNKNPYENDDTRKVDIPDFVEETDSTSVDMSIFKMSDDELYDDVPESDVEDKKPAKRKKSNAGVIICLVVAIFFILTTAVATIYALKEHKSASSYKEQLTQVKATNTDLQTQVDTLTAKVAELNKKIEDMGTAGTTTDPNTKYAKGTVLYITEDGSGMGVTKAANMNEFVSDKTLYWGNKVTLLADATKDADGNYWGKIDSGYIRIEYNGEIWATTDPQ